MKYRELLEYTKNNPGCLWTREQRQIHAESKFQEWATRKNKEYDPESEKKNNTRKNNYE